MLKNKTALSLSPLALLTLAACGGSGGGSTGTAVSGKAQNGPLENAWAYLDLHHGVVGDSTFKGDGIFNSVADVAAGITEVRVQTSNTGDFDLTDLGASDYTLAIETSALTTSNLADGTTGELYGSGVVLKAPEGATMVTPATTMVNAIMVADGVSAADAMADVAVALGFSATLDLNNFDAYKTPADAAEATLQFNMQVSNEQVMAVVKSLTSAAESAGVSSAVAYNVALKAVVDVVEAKVDAFDGGAAAGGATTLLNFTNDLAGIVTDLKTKVALEATYDATKAASFNAIANDAESGLNAAVTKLKALVEPTDAASIAANAKIVSAVNVVSSQIEAAAKVIVDGGTIATAQALVTISDIASFNTIANNPAPTGMTLSGSTTVGSVENVTVSEAATSLVVGTVAGVDDFTTTGVAVAGAVVANETFTYAIVGGPTDPLFTIDATTGVLSLVAQPDYEALGTNKFYEVSVSATDSSGKSVLETFKVNIGDVTESGAFGISSDTVTWTDYNPVVLASGLVAGTPAADLTHSWMTSTSGSQVALGTSGYAAVLSLQNLKNLFDDDASTIGKSPTLNFTLDTVPTGSGNATIKATIIDGTDGTRSSTENEISIEVNVAYLGDGTTATLTAPAGTATGSFTQQDGTSASFTVNNADMDAFSITAANAVTGMPASLEVKLEDLYETFISVHGYRDSMLEAGKYSIALETTLPLQNYADETVTKFAGTIELKAGNTKNSIVGTDGADTIIGTAGAEVIISGAGADTISTGGGADYIILASGIGSSVYANANTVAGHLTEPSTGTSGWTNGTDKFALGGSLTFDDLTVEADATTIADTNISITATGEYLMIVTGLAHGYITESDFVLTSEIV